MHWGELKRIFRLIPGLEKAEFVRMVVMHRNTFIDFPQLLEPTLRFKSRSTLLAAGQLVGTEGYTATTAGGWLAGINTVRLVVSGFNPETILKMTMIGALFEFISNTSPKYFQPMPPNFGIIPKLPQKVRNKRERYEQYRKRALENLDQ